MTDELTIEKRAGVGTITLNRPDAMNALTVGMLDALPPLLHELSRDPEVRCIVLTGAGDRAFSAGADLNFPDSDAEGGAPDTRSLEDSIDGLQAQQEAAWLLHQIPKPTLAAVNGAAAGASLSMAMACDLRVAVEHAVFRTAFAGIGFSGDFGGSYFMTQAVGSAKARELYFLGEKIPAPEALAMGMVHRVHPADTFRLEARELAERLAAGPPIAYRYMKRNLNLAETAHLRQVLDLEAEAMTRTGRTKDFQAAVRSFLSKTPAKFEGR